MWFRKNKDKENTSIWAKATSVSDLSKDIESLREREIKVLTMI